MVETVKIFNEVNNTDYDGIVVPTETVAFYSNQIKNVDNTKPTEDNDIRYSIKQDKNKWVKDNFILTQEEYNRYLDNIGALKRGDKYIKTRDGQYIIDFDNVLIYTSSRYDSPEISRVIRVSVDNPSDDGYTYITEFKEAIKEYERDRKNDKGQSFEDLAEIEQFIMQESTGRKITYTRDNITDFTTNATNDLGRQGNVRTKANYHFGDDERPAGDSEPSEANNYSLKNPDEAVTNRYLA